MTIPVSIDTKTIIVNLLKEDQRTFLSLDRLQKLLDYIFLELRKEEVLENYQISFDVNYDAITRTVIYNGNIFSLGMNGETIYLRNNHVLEEVAMCCALDDTLQNIVRNFSAQHRPLEAASLV